MKSLLALFAVASALVLSGCAQNSNAPKTDYSAFKQSKPRSILVLTPKNASPEINAGHSFLSEVTMPLAESGYYVFPVAVVEETFKQNGVSNANDINAIPVKKLHDIFGADAVLYLNVTDYGTSYQVINSSTRVTADARLVDLRSGKELWKKSATASSDEGNNNNGNNSLLGILITAAVTQIANTATDKSHDVAGVTSARLLSAGGGNGLLYGPRSPEYGKTAL